MIAQSAAGIVKRQVTPTVEGSDRMYLNVYVLGLQYEHAINRVLSLSWRSTAAICGP